MKATASNSDGRVTFGTFFCVAALFINAAYAECKYPNGNTVNGKIPDKQHCSRGYLVSNDQDFCLKGSLSEYKGPDRNGYPSWNPSVDKFGKVYTVQDSMCIPGGLVIYRKSNWCELDPVTKMGIVIMAGQACRGTIFQPMPPSN
jgi:hypothetical protein